MRNSTTTLTVLAVLAVLLFAGGVAAHGNNDTASDSDSMPENASAEEWATWMEHHMTEHMGADAAKQMEDHMGMTYEEMGEHMASQENGSMMDGMMSGRMMGDMMNGSMSGMGCH